MLCKSLDLHRIKILKHLQIIDILVELMANDSEEETNAITKDFEYQAVVLSLCLDTFAITLER